MSDRQVRRLLKDPQFNALVDEFRRDNLRDVSDGLAAKRTKLMITLDELLDPSTPAGVRLGAVRLVLQELRKYSEILDRPSSTEQQLATDPDRALLQQLVQELNAADLDEASDQAPDPDAD
jgi:hypothetical protein